MGNDDVKELVRKRGQCKAIITRIGNWLSENQDDDSPHNVAVRLEMIERAYIEFGEIEDKLLTHDNQTSDLVDFEDRYLNVKSQLRGRIGRRESSAHELLTAAINKLVEGQQSFMNESTDRSFFKQDGIKLPQMNIPPFSGRYSDFPSFKDLFEAAIHNNNSVTKAQKLQYLKGLLQGEAAVLVKHIAITDANYEETWEKICARYNKKKFVVVELITKVTHQPSINTLSASSLRHMHDTVDEVIRGLKVLGNEAQTRDPWIIYLLVDKLDSESKQAWAKYSNDLDFPTIDNFLNFLNLECNTLEAWHMSSKKTISKRMVNAASFDTRIKACVRCEKDHFLMNCDEFKDLSVPERRTYVATKGLCFNCLGVSHRADKCRSNKLCNICRRRHHTMLHQVTQAESANDVKLLHTNVEDNEDIVTTADFPDVTNLHIGNNFHSILPTALVYVKDNLGNKHTARILLDSGSQASFITENCWKKIHTPRKAARYLLSGLATSNIFTRGITKIVLYSTINDSIQIGIEALILENLPSTLSCGAIAEIDYKQWQNIELADPLFNKSTTIDIIVGADKFFEIVRGERIKVEKKKDFIAVETIFGWVVAGSSNSKSKLNIIENSNKSQNTLNLHLSVNIDQTLRAFWEIEEMSDTPLYSASEIKCEEHFQKTFSRAMDGRFIVSLPFKDDVMNELGQSRPSALRRLMAIEQKLSKNAGLRADYHQFMNEYLELGHMKLIAPDKLITHQRNTYYLPHHAVIKGSSTTTKLRVVFDGSCKTSSGISLNDKLLVGATIQPTLHNILLRFRVHRIVISGDIEKMYRQIWIAEQDRNYQRILWRQQPNLPVNDYQLLTVTYGTAAAPFLATRSLQQLAIECQDTHPQLADIIKRDFYVDDLLTGAATVEEATQLKSSITSILKSAGLNLRKWKSNSRDLNSLDIIENSVKFNSDDSVKILGLQWTPNEDIFSFKVAPNADNQLVSKRVILSESSRIFDPLGWLAPSTILVKILFQSLWLQNLGWDDPIPTNLEKTWHNVRNEFAFLEKLKIPRRVQNGQQLELHGFSDASEQAYAAVVYCRSVDINGVISVQLVTAKTKVAPIKTVSLPRLELCGAQLVTKLLAMLSTEVFDGLKPKLYAWTDSTIVLAWLSDHPSKWKTFVGNRVSYILEKIPRESWHYVPSKCNPADVASRGILPSILLNFDQWWHGPTWLATTDAWPNQYVIMQNSKATVKEKKIQKVHQISLHVDFVADILGITSSFPKLIRIVSYIFRFVKKLQRSNIKSTLTYLTAAELHNATEIIVKAVQAAEFSEEIRYLAKTSQVNKGNRLASLAPFIDGNGILRVGGRLQNAVCSYNTKHPVILPASHILSKMIVQHTHQKYLHPGVSLTFHLIRAQYWIINGRSLIRKEVRNCVTCARFKPTISQQMMGTLPEERVTPSRPFSQVGIDYAGPVSLLSRRARGAQTTKGYIAVFVCLVTKAIHVELVSELTTAAFLNTFKRFIARRGLPSVIFSDNGTNFVGAHNQLKIYNKEFNSTLKRLHDMNHILGTFIAQNNIDWKFIPPTAPHFGGLWESAVKSVKTHLIKATSNVNLTFEEMTTLLSGIESILNSRPICALSNDDESYEALTPAHFLIGQAMTALPEHPLVQDDVSKPAVKIYDEIRRRVSVFWKRFQNEYLNNLNQRQKWRHQHENLKIGDLVILKEKNLPTTCWPLARIIMVHPGKDNLVRVVTVKTATSTLKRPITTISKLPVG